MAKNLHFYKLIFAYSGAQFAGSAKQPNHSGVQDALDSALARVGAQKFAAAPGAKEAISQLASRTDKGVHALTNVGKIAFLYEINPRYVANKLNAECPGIWLRSISPCSEDFQPRFGAKMRSYRYVFRLQKSALKQEFAGVLKGKNLCALADSQLENMRIISREAAGEFGSKSAAFFKQQFATLPAGFCLATFVAAARALQGWHDFAALCLNAAEHASTRREIYRVRVYAVGEFLVFNIFSSGFLRGQIRLIMGALCALAVGKISMQEWLAQLDNQREFVRLSAPAEGLYLKSIYY